MAHKPRFIVRKSLSPPTAERSGRPAVYIEAVVEQALKELLLRYFPHEVLLQKPVLFGSLPIDMHRDECGLPVNTHLINFLKGGDTVVITVGNLLSGYRFQASSIWDAIAFEEFARNAFKRFAKICEHAEDYVKGRSGEKASAPSGRPLKS